MKALLNQHHSNKGTSNSQKKHKKWMTRFQAFVMKTQTSYNCLKNQRIVIYLIY